MIYRIDNLIECEINPITHRKYDASWIILMLTDSDEYQQLVGSHHGCAYTIKVSRTQCEDWTTVVGDFMSFQQSNGKNAILVMSKQDHATVQKHYCGHQYNDPYLRANEPTVLVHSTSMSSWEQIRKDGMLKCWSRLKSENVISETAPIGLQLGDPWDISDYIMFGSGVTGEIVVHSKQTGKITMDVDSKYLTGARLYFDAAKIAEDGLLMRDGCHVKVKDTLPLQPYLLWAATWENIGLESQISTPRVFAETSDRVFQDLFHP